MRQVGTKTESKPQILASGSGIAASAELGKTISQLAGGSSFVPKGLYRFKTHEEAAARNSDWLARGMAKIVLERKNG